jgi:hypothetical protein
MAAEQAIISSEGQPRKSAWFLPREHGATALALPSFFASLLVLGLW